MVWQRVLFWSLFLLLAAIALNHLIGHEVGLRISGARCADCKKTIAHGQPYCRGDFKRRIDEGRERLHQHRGTGV